MAVGGLGRLEGIKACLLVYSTTGLRNISLVSQD